MICLLLVAFLSQANGGGFELVATGDVMLSRGVGRQIADQGVHYPFEHVRGVLSSADLTFVNLECVLSSLGEPMPRKEFTFLTVPEAAQGLQAAGIDVVSVSNNHSMDYGPDALLEMNDILAHHGIASVGAGRNERSAHREALLRVGDTTVAFLAYTEDFWLTVEATETEVGASVIRNEALIADIRRAKSQASIVVVSFHWGWEYSDHPTDKDRARAYLSIDTGADLVIGHHPHVIQGVERYKHGLICYSLGNFIFDQRRPSTQRGLLLRCRFNGQGVEHAEWLPIAIHPQEYRPRLATDSTAEEILVELQTLSQALNTSLERTSENSLQLQVTPQVADGTSGLE